MKNYNYNFFRDKIDKNYHRQLILQAEIPCRRLHT